MKHALTALLPLALALASSPALAGAENFVLVNGTGVDLSDLSIRRTGSGEWRPLGPAPAAGAASSVVFSDPDCAFDIRAGVAGGSATWRGVNLCGTSRLTLRRRPTGETWVDYD